MTVNKLCFYSISMLMLLSKSESSISLKIELVFNLQKFFKSDLILIVKKDENDTLIGKFYKFKNLFPKVFIGTINLKELSQKQLHSSFKNVMVVTDSGEKVTEKLVELQGDRSALITTAIWINFIDEVNEELTKDLYIPFNARFLLIKKTAAFNYEIVDVYQIAESSPKIFSLFAVYQKNELQIFPDNYPRSMDLKGHQLNIVLSSFTEFQEKYGYYWKLFSEAMNFSIYSNYTTFGNIYANGTKTGLFKLLEEHVVDGTPYNYVYNHQRKEVYDYIFPAKISETRMYLKLETKLNWTSYTKPFSREIWLSIFIWVITSSCVMHIIIRSYRHKNFDHAILNVLKGLCCQSGMKLQNQSIPLCISYLMPYLMAMVLIQYYSGSLLSYITVKHFEEPFQSLSDVIKDGTYRISVKNGGYLLFYITTDNGEDAKSIRNGLLLGKNELPEESNEDTFNQLCEKRWIFLHDADNIIIHAKCLIVELNEIIFLDSLGMIVWKNFPYQYVMTKLMRRFQFAGLIKLKETNRIIYNEDFGSFKPLSMDMVFPIFLFYLSVIVLSVSILLAEMKWKNLSEKYRHKQRKKLQWRQNR